MWQHVWYYVVHGVMKDASMNGEMWQDLTEYWYWTNSSNSVNNKQNTMHTYNHNPNANSLSHINHYSYNCTINHCFAGFITQWRHTSSFSHNLHNSTLHIQFRHDTICYLFQHVWTRPHSTQWIQWISFIGGKAAFLPTRFTRWHILIGCLLAGSLALYHASAHVTTMWCGPLPTD